MWELFVWLLWYIAVPAGLGYLGGVLLAPDEPEDRSGIDVEGAQSRSWNPRTMKAEGIPRPRAYGENMHHGNIVAQWTQVDADREELYMVVEHGDGPTQGIGANLVYLNDQPAGNYSAVAIQERLGTMDQTVMTGFEQTKLEYAQNIELVHGEGPTTFTTPNDFFDDLSFTIVFPNGLITRRKDGSDDGVGSKLQVRIRPLGGGWTTIWDAYLNGEQYDPKFFSFLVSDYYAINKGTQYELQFSRTVGDDSDRSIQNMHLRSIREVVDTPFTRPGKALLGIRAVATRQLSGSIDVKVVREDRIINTYDGTNWTLQYSNNRAWVVWDILTQPIVSGSGPYAVERYEGIDPAYLDLEFFYAWSIFCAEEILDGYGGTEARAACNIILDQYTDAFSMAKKLAAVGRAQIYWSGDKLTGWIDTVNATPIDLVTMDNKMAKTWKSTWAIAEELVGVVEILYKDSAIGYEMTTAEYASKDLATVDNVVSLEGLGITSRGPAIHYAKYLITRNELIRNTNNFTVAKDGFRYALGDTLRVQSRPSNWGKAYRVVSSTADTVTVDRDVTGDVAIGDVLHLRTYDGVTEQVVTDTYTVDSVLAETITITVPWDAAPIKGNLIATGVVKLRRITKLTTTSDNYFKVEAETYDPVLFDADLIDPDNPNINYQWPGALPNLNPELTRKDLDDIVTQILPPQPNIEIPWLSNCTWTGSGGDTVTWSKTDADFPITFRYRGTTYEITPDSTTAEYIYWDPTSTTVFLSHALASTALDTGHWLMCINTDGVAHPANAQQLLHAGVLLAGTIRAETYLELRNTYVYNGDDSLDNSKPLEIPFKIVSEMIDIVSAKLSFRLMPYRAYSTAASSGGANTSGAGGGQTSSAGGGQTSSGASGWPTNKDTSTVDPGDTDNEDLGTHKHEMPTHDHTISGDTATENGCDASTANEDGADSNTGYEDGDGSHRHTISGISHDHSISGRSHDHGYGSLSIASKDPGDTYNDDLGQHSHTMGTHKHTYNLDDHDHTVTDHDHTVTDHDHTTPDHTHDITFGLHEESNSPTVHYHIDNGAGFGGASGNFNSDQLDIDISGSLSGTGWKSIRFDSDLRCRVAVIVELKLDIDA